MPVDMPSHPFQIIPQTPSDLRFFRFFFVLSTGIFTFQHRPQVFSICFGLGMPRHHVQITQQTPLDLRCFLFVFLVFSTGIFTFKHRPQICGTFGLNRIYTGIIRALYGHYTVWSAFLKPFFHIGQLLRFHTALIRLLYYFYKAFCMWS